MIQGCRVCDILPYLLGRVSIWYTLAWYQQNDFLMTDPLEQI